MRGKLNGECRGNELDNGLALVEEQARSYSSLRRHSVHPETIYVTTDDGWSLAVHHFRGRAPKRHHPIVLLHGMATNRVNMHAETQGTLLALMAAEHGFDVFVGEVRGRRIESPAGRCLARLSMGLWRLRSN